MCQAGRADPWGRITGEAGRVAADWPSGPFDSARIFGRVRYRDEGPRTRSRAARRRTVPVITGTARIESAIAAIASVLSSHSIHNRTAARTSETSATNPTMS